MYAVNPTSGRKQVSTIHFANLIVPEALQESAVLALHIDAERRDVHSSHRRIVSFSKALHDAYSLAHVRNDSFQHFLFQSNEVLGLGHSDIGSELIPDLFHDALLAVVLPTGKLLVHDLDDEAGSQPRLTSFLGGRGALFNFNLPPLRFLMLQSDTLHDCHFPLLAGLLALLLLPGARAGAVRTEGLLQNIFPQQLRRRHGGRRSCRHFGRGGRGRHADLDRGVTLLSLQLRELGLLELTGVGHLLRQKRLVGHLLLELLLLQLLLCLLSHLCLGRVVNVLEVPSFWSFVDLALVSAAQVLHEVAESHPNGGVHVGVVPVRDEVGVAGVGECSR
mmetsp:Transcript_38269/g.123104  ORF Transcript_38269/g.123104 Transcript_38269/m.123104 type:complete len:334 (-) Transcript_38269:340-1341(-)